MTAVGLALVSLWAGAGSAWAAASEGYFTALPAWGSATQLTVPRTGAVGVGLPGGKVLIAGGANLGGAYRSAEVFDPVSGTFTALPASGNTQLTVPRDGAVGVALADGKVLIAGGSIGGSALRSAELFDPVTGTFTALPASGNTQLTESREGAVGVRLPDGKVLIAGGHDVTGRLESRRRSAELFDPVSSTFTALPASGDTQLTVPRVGAVGVALADGKVLVAGGWGDGSYLRSAELFDPATGTFTALPASGTTQLTVPRDGAVGVALPDGKVLIAGGSDYGGTNSRSAELFDSGSGTFTALPESGTTQLTVPRADAVGVALKDGNVLIAGGWGDGSHLRSMEVFDPVSGSFAALPASGSATQLTVPRWGAAGIGLPDGTVLIAGGQNLSSLLRSAELFDPVSRTFRALPAPGNTQLTVPHSGAVGVALPDGKVLIAGGIDGISRYGGNPVRSAEVFDPASRMFTALPPSGITQLTVPRADTVGVGLPDGKVLIAGGWGWGGSLRSAEVFDPASGTFTALPESGNTQLTVTRSGAVGVRLPDGKVLITGGFGGISRYGGDRGDPLRSAEVFDPVSETFTALPESGNTQLMVPRADAVGVALPDGKVLITGGVECHGCDPLRSAEVFDPVSGTFTALPAVGITQLMVPRADAVGVALPDGKVLIAGGWNGLNDLQSAELFVSAPESLVVGGDFGSGTVGRASAVQGIQVTNQGAQVLVIGGGTPEITSSTGAAGDFALVDDRCSGRRLAFGQSCTLAVRFTPAAVGLRSAALVLADNEPSGSLSIPLTGTGLPAEAGPVGSSGPAVAAGRDSALVLVAYQARVSRSRVIVRYALTARAAITLTVKPPKGKSVTVARATGRVGLNAISWNRRVRGRAAGTGTYKLTITATADGRTAKSTLTVKLKSPRRAGRRATASSGTPAPRRERR